MGLEKQFNRLLKQQIERFWEEQYKIICADLQRQYEESKKLKEENNETRQG